MELEEHIKKPRGRPRKRKNKSWKRTETHELYDGDVLLFRCAPSGKIWQFQVWISQEARVYRRSTKTRNIEDAIRVAKEYYIAVQVKLANETPVFPHSAEELALEWLEHRKRDVGHMRTEGRWMVLRTQLKHWLNFVGHHIKINDISKNRYDEYYSHRRQLNPEVTNGTLVAEKGTIRSMYRWAIDRGFLHYTALPQFPTIPKGRQQRRCIEVSEYRQIYEYMRSEEWLKNCNPGDEVFRQQIRYMTLVLANTGIRLGECRRLTWAGVKKIYKEKGKKRHQWTVELFLEENQTKNKKARKVQGRRADVFVDLKKLTDFTNRNDLVFCDFHTGKELQRHKVYKHWNSMLKATGLDQHEEPPTFYHLRHFYATQRLYAGVRPYNLHENMGCSMKYLEEQYGHVDTTVVRRDLLKDARYDDVGVVIEDI